MSTAALVLVYAAIETSGADDAAVEMATSEPPCSRIARAAWRNVEAVPMMFSSQQNRQALSSSSRNGPGTAEPAFATAMSRRPLGRRGDRDSSFHLLGHRDVAGRRRESGAGHLVTQLFGASPRAPPARRAAIVTTAPCRARPSAIPRPMPVPPPVINAWAPSSVFGVMPRITA